MKKTKPTKGNLNPVVAIHKTTHRSWTDISRDLEIYWDSKSLSNDFSIAESDRFKALEEENARLKEAYSLLYDGLQTILDIIKRDVDRIKTELKLITPRVPPGA
ncbi:hypothetical protein [Taibaiella chishuiensis]|uniref:Uncharacterized protein n=1 Tax=Taibaiella chishuiensis TaxID=1434707 RepID=A0A2P8CT54_9BACT|nr:hypothetical protein [Taibaiella chishuiensis]PSK88130.1 hypothetical protein B0I18_11524 [Taibaiella chishuiensis]